jgi:hypothetical protein
MIQCSRISSENQPNSDIPRIPEKDQFHPATSDAQATDSTPPAAIVGEKAEPLAGFFPASHYGISDLFDFSQPAPMTGSYLPVGSRTICRSADRIDGVGMALSD